MVKYKIINKYSSATDKDDLEWSSMAEYREWRRENERSKSRNGGEVFALLMFDGKLIHDDIGSMAYTQGSAERRFLEKTDKSASIVSDFIAINSEDNLPLIKRIIDVSLSDAERVINNGVRSDVVVENYINEEDVYAVEFNVSDNTTDMSIIHLRNTIHDYIVNRIMSEWSGMTYPKFAEQWDKKIESNLIDMEKDAYSTSRPEHWFNNR